MGTNIDSNSKKMVSKLIKRLKNFNKQDWKHVSFLFKNGIKQFLKGDFHESKEAFIWIKIHMSYDSKKID